ncbi:MAG: EndoU domain-containing protein [Actinobacteria bacterium]|nr:EndoU domain-containing protein [Actinomycetota bacterium]MCA1721538.1 EndoU domain-containing protein [Actinomycetota bacterium]
MTDDEYVALVQELEDIVRSSDPAEFAGSGLKDELMIWNEPSVAIYAVLYDDALGTVVLPEATHARVWQIAAALECDWDEIMPTSVLERARPERRTRPPQPVLHPLKGGGHGPGRGIPGKSEFPARWSDDAAIDHTMSVATEPDGAVQQPDGTFRAWGVRDGVDLRVIVTELGHVQSSYPVTGEGVVTNPLDELRRPYVERLQRLVDAAPFDDPARAGAAELLAAGEWDQVVLHLRAVTSGEELDALAEAAGL